MCWKLHELHKYAVKDMHTLRVYALNFEILKISAASEIHFKSILMFKLGGKFNICGLDHFASEPFNQTTYSGTNNKEKNNNNIITAYDIINGIAAQINTSFYSGDE